MGQNRRPGSGAQRDLPKGQNGIIAPAGVDVSALPPSVAVALKLEAVKKMQPTKDGMPPLNDGEPPALTQSGAADAQRASEPREVPKQETEAERRKREDKLLEAAASVNATRALLSLAFNRPHPEPARPVAHHDLVLQEMRWMANDFAQERLWKRTAARVFAYAAAAVGRKGGLRATPLGNQIRADTITATAQEDSLKARRERVLSNRNAGTSGTDGAYGGLDTGGELSLPAGLLEARLTYTSSEDTLETLERHLRESIEADTIARLQEEREWEEEVETARRAAAEAAEVKREREIEEANETAADDDDIALGLNRTKRKKKGRLAAHILEDFVELDESPEAETPIGRRLGGPSRRPSMPPRPTSGLSDRQGSDSERQVRKKRRPRDFDDEDYEEPLPPRRVSARKSAQAAAAADMARKGGFIRNQMDKRGSAPNKKMQRVDSMQYGLGRRGVGGGAGQSIPWTEAEDRLLCAIVHEFGSNWHLVADVLSSSSSMQGIYRSNNTCRYRFRSVTSTSVPGEPEPSEESALAAMQMDKTSARLLLNTSLPVPSDVLSGHQKALVQIGQRARQLRRGEEMRAKSIALQRTEPHPSYNVVVSAALHPTNGIPRKPMELVEMAEAAASAQAMAAAAQAAAQAQTATMGGLPPVPGLAPPMGVNPAQVLSPAQAFPPLSAPGVPPMPPQLQAAGPQGSFSATAQQPQMPPQQQQQQPQQHQLPVAGGQPPGLPNTGTPVAEQLQHQQQMAASPGLFVAQQQQQHQQQQMQMQMQQPPVMQQQAPVINGVTGPGISAVPSAVGSPAPHMQPASAGMSSPGMSSFGMQMPGGMPSPAVQQQQSQQAQQQSRINPAQLHQILQKNQLPDGRQLNEQMRQIIVQKLQLQQNRDPQQQQMLQQRGMRPGMQPGMSQATPAHLQAMQNMARLQHSMQQQQSGQPPGSMPGQMPPGMRPPAGFPIGNPGPGGIANPAALAGLGNAAPMGSPAALGTAPGGLPGQPRPAMPPMAPGQMMAGGLPGAQMPGAIANLPNLLAQTTTTAKPPGSGS